MWAQFMLFFLVDYHNLGSTSLSMWKPGKSLGKTLWKQHSSRCLSVCNNWREMHLLPLVSQGRLRQGYDSHQSQQVQKVSHRGWGEGEKKEKKKEMQEGEIKMPRMQDASPGLTQGFFVFCFFCSLQTAAIHCGAILSAFFSFISKLLKTTL